MSDDKCPECMGDGFDMRAGGPEVCGRCNGEGQLPEVVWRRRAANLKACLEVERTTVRHLLRGRDAIDSRLAVWAAADSEDHSAARRLADARQALRDVAHLLGREDS